METQTEPPYTPLALPLPPQNSPLALPSTPRAARVIDPQIARIKAETKAKVAEYRKSAASKKLLATIQNKLIVRLTKEDQKTLRFFLDNALAPDTTVPTE